MRMLLKVGFPTDQANQAVRDGRLAQVQEQQLASLKPEAAYFFLQGGTRGGFMVFDLTDPSQIPTIAEPLFGLGATVEFHPVMNLDDLTKGMMAAAQAAQPAS